MKRIILIGGASAVGKTTLAKKLGSHLNLPWLSADYIHDMALVIGKREDFPQTFATRDFTAEEFYQKYSIDDVVQTEIAESKETWRGINALIESGFEGIIEGVAILPKLVNSLSEPKDLQCVFLTNENRDEIFEIALSRGIWDDAHTYGDKVKEKEVEFALAYNEYIKAEAKKYGYSMVSVSRNDSDLEKVLKILENE